MKARKKMEIYYPGDKNPWPPESDYVGNSSVTARNLPKTLLGGVIFGCKHSTMSECLEKQLFGLPGPHISYVRKVEPGLPLFLFNYSDRKLHGIFEAACHGQLNLDPYGWTDDGKDRTPFPAQVRIFTKTRCRPLEEDVFRPVISKNYYSHHHFHFELDRTQVNNLMALFKPVEARVDPRSSRLTSKDENFWTLLPSRRKETRKFNNKGKSRIEVSSHSSESSSTTEEREDTEFNDSPEEKTLGIPSSKKDNIVLPHEFLSNGNGHRRMEDIIMKLKSFAESSKTDIQTEFDEKVIENVSPSSNDNPKIAEPVPDNSMLVKIIEELRERVTLLEMKQMESERELKELRRTIRERGDADSDLKKHSKEMENKLQVSGMSSSASEDFFSVPGELVYIIGGFDGDSWLSDFDSYSLSFDSLTSLRPMSVVRSYASAAALGGHVYVFGGGDGSIWYSTVQCYDRETDQWTRFPSLAREKGNLAGVTFNGKIFAIGGGNRLESFDDVEMIDPLLGKWVNHPPMIHKRFSLAAAEMGGSLYAVGGFDGDTYLRSGERFDPREGIWTRIPNMNAPRGCHSMAVLNDKLYVVGGCEGKGQSGGVEVYDPRASCWYKGEEMNTARGYSAAVVVSGSLYVIGGVSRDNHVLDSVECYNEGTGWRVTDLSALGKRAFFSAIVI